MHCFYQKTNQHIASRQMQKDAIFIGRNLVIRLGVVNKIVIFQLSVNTRVNNKPVLNNHLQRFPNFVLR